MFSANVTYRKSTTLVFEKPYEAWNDDAAIQLLEDGVASAGNKLDQSMKGWKNRKDPPETLYGFGGYSPVELWYQRYYER